VAEKLSPLAVAARFRKKWRAAGQILQLGGSMAMMLSETLFTT